ncbi:peptidoglycan DD-metalloendopeptidase family protein [Baekduia soli]|uniref:Peptidoglycan DD-metalloendopeptidase family protein n=1 Tax=Baekduia soli TaxID=496014 RepID=A0A5B8UBM4_9ACTN|nr:peptidoglycan DD-metalloendopeptidase family protein [Baekduia soli]QEC50031.1 peptidoglycan DD-metalloendopeptidase family protein [Baekduia soli]
MRLRLALGGIVLPVVLCAVLWLVLPLGSQADSPQGKAASIQKKIDVTRSRIGRRKGTEHVLTSDITAWSKRIARLQGSISTLQSREARIQSDLDARRAELASTQSRLRSERARLARLRVRLAQGRVVLARRLRQLYEADRPDLVTVVLNSKGFADLLERGQFLSAIQRQDAQILTLVKSAKADATATAARLDTLEGRQQQLTRIVLQRRDQVAQVKQQLIDTRVGYQQTRAGKQAALTKVRGERKALEDHLSELQKESARVQAELAPGAPGLPAGPIKGGSGRFIWPVNGPITAPFCESRPWEACHPGMDIGVPTGTPIRAADGGRVAIAGWVGGYGNYTCIQHSASLSTCYGHQSVLKVSVGQQVSQGQVIGLSGSTGHSTGPHLHFEVRVNGAVTNPLNYL